MAADADISTPSSASRGPLSRRRVDILVARASAGFGVLFCIATVGDVVEQLDEVIPAWSTVIVPTLYASILLALAAAISRKLVRRSQILVAVVFLVGLLTWPLATSGAGTAPHATHWLGYLLGVAVAMAVAAFPPAVATGYLVVSCSVLAIGRVLGGAEALDSVLDAAFSLILGGVLLLVVHMLRVAADSVDAVTTGALQEYASAVRQHALEAERVQVDSIVHDSVLTTLLAAARAETPETRALASTMASNAIGHLRQAGRATPVDGAGVQVVELARRITEAADELSVPFDVITRVGDGRSLPPVAADAVYAAAVQAMVNSVQHAGDDDVSRWLVVRTYPSLSVEVEVGDAGRGFDPGTLTGGRLGLRVSMVERVESAGGYTVVESMPGVGTTITVRWPREEEAE